MSNFSSIILKWLRSESSQAFRFFVASFVRCLSTLVLVWSVSSCAAIQTQSGEVVALNSADSTTPYFAMSDGYRLSYSLNYSHDREPTNSEDSDPLPMPDVSDLLVLALHGFNDYRNAFVDLCQYVSARGADCIAYDQRGFGETDQVGIWPESGRLQVDLSELIVRLSQRYPEKRLLLVGESMGGAVIMTAQRQYPELFQTHVAGSVLLAPAVWARSTQPWYQRWLLWLAVHTVPSWQPTGEGLGVQASDNIDALRAMGRDPLVIKKTRIDAIYGLNNLMDQALEASSVLTSNSLLLYGDKDEVIPKNATCKALLNALEAGSALRYRIYPNGYHMLSRDLQRERVFEDVLMWGSSANPKERFKAMGPSVREYCHEPL